MCSDLKIVEQKQILVFVFFQGSLHLASISAYVFLDVPDFW